MPQPIRSPKIVHVHFAPDSILSKPNLAAHIVVISGIWNEMEARIGLLVATLLNADPRTGVSMFLAITNDGAKRAALDAVCVAKLSIQEQAEFQLILRSLGLMYGERNRALHGVWGVSETYPDKLVWGDIRDAVIFHADMMSIMPPDMNDARFDRIIKYQKTLVLYEEKDFQNIIQRMNSAYTDLKNFTQPYVDRAFGSSGLILPTRPAKPRRASREKPAPNAS